MQAGASRAEQAPDKQNSEPAAGLFTISCHCLTCHVLALPGPLQPQLWDASEGLLVRGNNSAESPFKPGPSNPAGQGICKQSVLLGGAGSSEAAAEVEVCPVCQEPLGQELTMLPCGHQLCVRCHMAILDRIPPYIPMVLTSPTPAYAHSPALLLLCICQPGRDTKVVDFDC